MSTILDALKKLERDKEVDAAQSRPADPLAPAPAPVLAAVASMAGEDDPMQPASMTLMGGPIDTRRNPTAVNELAASSPSKTPGTPRWKDIAWVAPSRSTSTSSRSDSALTTEAPTP